MNEMDELEDMLNNIRTIVKNKDVTIKQLNKSLYDKEGDLSRITSLWQKEKLISGEFEKKFKKLNEMFKGVK